MVDGCSETWWTHLSMLGIVPEVKLGDLMSGEEDVPDSIVSCRGRIATGMPLKALGTLKIRPKG